MAENPPARVKALSRHGAWTPTYRYRSPQTDGRDTLPRLNTVDLDLLGLRLGDRVLDVGCGTGRHVIEALRRDCYAVGVDCDRRELGRLQFYGYCLAAEGGMRGGGAAVLGDGARLPFRDGAFDRVICTEVLEHVPDDHLLVRELARLLRPGGTIAVSVPDLRAEAVVWGLARIQKRRPGEHLRIYRHRQLADLLRENGFSVYARRYRHSLESPYWFLSMGSNERSARRALSSGWREFVDGRASEGSRFMAWVEEAANHIVPKSAVFYARKPERGRVC